MLAVDAYIIARTKQTALHTMKIKDVTRLLISLKKQISDDYRATDDPDDNSPGMQVTIATTDGKDWDYQTGDNSYSGACYHYRHWAVIYLYRRSDCRALAREAVAECMEEVWRERREKRDARLAKRFAGRSPFTLWIAPYQQDGAAQRSRFVFPMCKPQQHAACV